MASEHTNGVSLNNALTMIERATHFPTALLILAFLIALDIGLVVQYQNTLLGLTWEFIAQNISVGVALFFIFLFGLFMSLGMGIIKYFADMIALATFLPVWDKLFPNQETRQIRGAVLPFQLREAAHLEQNKFYLDLLNEYETQQKGKRAEEWALASSALTCIILEFIDYTILPQLGHSSLLNQLVAHGPDWALLLIIFFNAILLFLWLYPIVRADRHSEWVYCLPLYNKIENERRQEREKFRH